MGPCSCEGVGPSHRNRLSLIDQRRVFQKVTEYVSVQRTCCYDEGHDTQASTVRHSHDNTRLILSQNFVDNVTNLDN
jgi:hypothetical protein